MLRNYQSEDFQAIENDIVNGQTRLLLVHATGLGKTVMMSHVCGNLSRIVDSLSRFRKTGKRSLIIVNRDTLVTQTIEKLNKTFPNLTISVEQAQEYADTHSDVVIATIQTLGSAKKNELGEPDWKKRLSRFNPDEFGLVIVDESHNSASAIYRNVLKYFKVYKSDPIYNDPNKILLMVTATPNRSDNQGLEEFVDKITGAYEDPVTGARGRGLPWAVKNGWLARPHGRRVNTEVNLDGVSIVAGDFNEKELNNAVNTDKRNPIAVDEYVKECDGEHKKAVAFTVNIDHANALAAKFNERGIRAAAVSSKMSNKECDKIFQAFKIGYFKVLCGCDKFTEGFDDPSIEMILMLRPTKSSRWYTQAVGRGARLYPSPEDLAVMRANGIEPDFIKEYFTVIDYVDVSSRHSLFSIPRLFGLSSKLDCQGKDVLDIAEKMQGEVKKLSPSQQNQVKLDEIPDMATLKATIENIDLLSIPTVPDHIAAISPLNWIGIQNGYQIGLANNQTHVLRENSLGGFDAYVITKGINKYQTTYPSLEAAIKSVDAKIPEDQRELVKANASWRTAKVPPTENQLAVLIRARSAWSSKFASADKFKEFLLKNHTKGSASDLIQKLASRMPLFN